MEKLENKLKEILNKDKKTSNLILIVILLVIVLISMNYIFNSETNQTPNNSTNEIQDTSKNTDNLEEYSTNLEKRLSNILAQINGIKEANVLLTYSTTDKTLPVYDVKEDVSVEKEDSKTSTKTITEKKVAYEDTKEGKEAIVQSKEVATATGAIIALKGEVSGEIISKVKDAVSSITGIPIHKIQIFSN